MQRLTAIISGRVQRGGFRIRTWKDALPIGVHGNVKNLPGGAVQVVAEGEQADLEKFTEALAVKGRNISVSAIEKRYSPVTGEFKAFEILWDEKDAELYEVAEVLIEAFANQAQDPD
jgi:acylphosphatase